MIKSIKHKGLKAYWTKGKSKGLNPDFLIRVRLQLETLDAASKPEDMNRPGWYFHSLHGNMAYSVRVNKNWRLTFSFDGEDAVDINLEDYH